MGTVLFFRIWKRGLSPFLWVVLAPAALAGSIDTAFLEQPWPNQRVRQTEVGRHPVTWRERAGKEAGIFAAVQFVVPLDREATWRLANEYQDVGHITPGVTAVRYLERTETRQVIQVDVKILWKKLQLTFEVEQEPPDAVRFRLVNRILGEYRGLCRFEEASEPGTDGVRRPATAMELVTWLQPARPVPQGLLLAVERITMLRGVRDFLKACDRAGVPRR